MPNNGAKSRMHQASALEARECVVAQVRAVERAAYDFVQVDDPGDGTAAAHANEPTTIALAVELLQVAPKGRPRHRSLHPAPVQRGALPCLGEELGFVRLRWAPNNDRATHFVGYLQRCAQRLRIITSPLNVRS